MQEHHQQWSASAKPSEDQQRVTRRTNVRVLLTVCWVILILFSNITWPLKCPLQQTPHALSPGSFQKNTTHLFSAKHLPTCLLQQNILSWDSFQKPETSSAVIHLESSHIISHGTLHVPLLAACTTWNVSYRAVSISTLLLTEIPILYQGSLLWYTCYGFWLIYNVRYPSWLGQTKQFLALKILFPSILPSIPPSHWTHKPIYSL